MNKFIEFCISNEIRFDISNVINSKEIIINLYKYDCKSGKHVGLAELRGEGLDLEDIRLDFAKDFNDLPFWFPAGEFEGKKVFKKDKNPKTIDDIYDTLMEIRNVLKEIRECNEKEV